MLLDPGEIPVDSIGEASATRGAAASITDLSISNWKTEIRNALANLRGKRQSDIMEGKQFFLMETLIHLTHLQLHEYLTENVYSLFKSH